MRQAKGAPMILIRGTGVPARDSIKWQSNLFPKLTLTEDHYREMRARFPHIESFRDEMKKLEDWLWVNESRRPKSRWKKAIGNWMRKAEIYAIERRKYRLIKGKERPMSHQEASKSLAEILAHKTFPS